MNCFYGSGASSKRASTGEEGEGEGSEAFPGYRLDTASGWYISKTDPAWQYDAARAIFYNATGTVYYTVATSTTDLQ